MSKQTHDFEWYVNRALDVANTWGSIDGGHHKQWVIDQMVRALCGTDEDYQKWVRNWESLAEESWGTGIAP